ncbi:hypothetical protein CoNPh13_CDS0148 [Staphylococcus phage S-CoN_Ph13]|nr:hypothetical protein CoNPh7_CDS0120 [Staphylococcus phage S-CoN_Ph7]WNM53618.1 hypothetical protein CoNPh13_CDS0148 [Staphylococcus phage S-CoN_Ph13]
MCLIYHYVLVNVPSLVLFLSHLSHDSPCLYTIH